MLLPKRGTSRSTENTSDRIVTSFLTGIKKRKRKRKSKVMIIIKEMDGLLTKTSKDNAQIDMLVIAGKNRKKRDTQYYNLISPLYK